VLFKYGNFSFSLLKYDDFVRIFLLLEFALSFFWLSSGKILPPKFIFLLMNVFLICLVFLLVPLFFYLVITWSRNVICNFSFQIIFYKGCLNIYIRQVQIKTMRLIYLCHFMASHNVMIFTNMKNTNWFWSFHYHMGTIFWLFCFTWTSIAIQINVSQVNSWMPNHMSKLTNN
jgi:hypothetical protein